MPLVLPPVKQPFLKQVGELSQHYGNGRHSGGGKGWSGWSGGGNWKQTSQKPTPVSEDFQVDENARYLGKVKFYRKWSGYGFLELVQTGVVPEDKVYVNWQNITTEDRFPSLVEGIDVEFGLLIVNDSRHGGVRTLKAKNVTLPGGGLICVQDELDSEKKEFVGGQYLRYTGVLKWYSQDRGLGYIALDEGFQLPSDVPKEIPVEMSEVNAGGRQPESMKEIKVEFGIWKTKRAQHKAYNMTLPGGVPLLKEGLENRQILAGQMFTGTVSIWNWRQGWGFVKAAEGTVFPPEVNAKIDQMNKDTLARGKEATGSLYFRKHDIKPGVKLDKGQTVTFQVYTDDKGAGALEIS